MQNIRRLITKYLGRLAVAMVAAVLVFSTALQLLSEQRQARETAASRFYQIEQVLKENQQELEKLMEDYRQTCMKNAESIAYIVEHNPDVLESVEELRRIAAFTEVDEIHLFDTEGVIFGGTHPEFFGYSFDSGEQMAYFKPMLQDRTLRLSQEITPNTAEGKLMQYTAIWSEHGDMIVQVGMEPLDVLKVTEKNQLSYIFSLLRANRGVSFYAIDSQSGEIMGATTTEDVGRYAADVGFDLDKIDAKPNGFHAKINGVTSFCVFSEIGSNQVGRVVSNDMLYSEVPLKTVNLTACLSLVALLLVLAMLQYMDKFVIADINQINGKLRIITGGNLDEQVDVDSSREFFELSQHINEMIRSLLSGTEKISYVLNRTNMRIGVYEYSENMASVRYTEYVPKILNLDADKIRLLTSDHTQFHTFIEELRRHPIPDETGVFRLPGSHEVYIELEEIVRGRDTMGIVRDVTEEIIRRRQIEAERDQDLLTGLYNRRGLENRLSALFAAPDALGFGAVMMIDADGLKEINDQFGHEKGDVYLQRIAETITSVGQHSRVAARQGGDEFVLLLYHYDSEEEVLDSIELMKYLQNHSMARLSSDISVPLRFSFGYSLIKNEHDYRKLLHQADERMYVSKRGRKRPRE